MVQHRILVVDDEPDLETLIKQKFRKQIRANQYEFLFAFNGAHALEILQESSDVDLVLSDINMPVMDGLTLLLRLKEEHNLLKTVVVSAYGDIENIRTAMNRGAFDFLIKPIDFKDLEITIEKTLNQVKAIKKTLLAVKENNILKMYVDESVLNFMGSKQLETSLFANEQMEGTVAFIDICGFTQISETQSPDKVVEMLNKYFDIMVNEIIQEEGIIDKFIGDAVMATFKGEYHLDRAVDCCIAIRDSFQNLEEEAKDGIFNPQVSIGINSGEMIWGNIGSTSLKRLDYTVIGDVVNIAARLQSLAGESQILINDSCYEKVKESFTCKHVGKLSLKNKRRPIDAYEVLS